MQRHEGTLFSLTADCKAPPIVPRRCDQQGKSRNSSATYLLLPLLLLLYRSTLPVDYSSSTDYILSCCSASSGIIKHCKYLSRRKNISPRFASSETRDTLPQERQTQHTNHSTPARRSTAPSHQEHQEHDKRKSEYKQDRLRLAQRSSLHKQSF